MELINKIKKVRVLVSEGKIETAIIELENIIESYPNIKILYYFLYQLYEIVKKVMPAKYWIEGIKTYPEFKEILKKESRVYLNIGWYYYFRQRYNNAIENFNLVAEICNDIQTFIDLRLAIKRLEKVVNNYEDHNIKVKMEKIKRKVYSIWPSGEK